MTHTPTQVAGANVRGAMARRGITQVQMATLLGVSQPAVSARLRGETPFDVNELARVAKALDVPIERLVEGIDELPGIEFIDPPQAS